MARMRSVGIGWVLAAILAVIYLALPESDDSPARPRHNDDDEKSIAITDVLPSDPAPGSVIVVRYTGHAGRVPTHAWLGKIPLELIAEQSRSVVARLPNDQPLGPAKLRLGWGAERSKGYELVIKAINWQKPFRNLCGGLALLILGVQILARGSRGVVGIGGAQRVTKLASSRLAALSFGATIGIGMQSTTAAAGLLAGGVGSRVLPVVSAAALYLGAQLGTALAPLVAGSVTEPRWGGIVIAMGTIVLGLAADRRTKALARLLLGIGMVAFGVQVLRPGFEPIVSNPTLLAAIDQLTPQGLPSLLATTLLGALLVALFQGPAPVLVLALGVAETTGHSNVRTTLVMLAGSGLGAGLGALLTLPGGADSRKLAQLSLLAGALNTVFALVTVDLFDWLASRLVAGNDLSLRWGKHLLPSASWQIAVAFALSQLSAAALLIPSLPHLQRILSSRPKARPATGVPEPLPAAAVSRGLAEALAAQSRALPAVFALAVRGARFEGRKAELQLNSAHASLRDLFDGPVPNLPLSQEGVKLGRLSLACLQLQRSLEQVLRQAERFTESRFVDEAEGTRLETLSERDENMLCEMHGLIADGLETLRSGLQHGALPDPDGVRAREIHMNSVEARARRTLLLELIKHHDSSSSLRLIELSDAYEAAGNQLYRMAELLSDDHDVSDAPPAPTSSIPAKTLN